MPSLSLELSLMLIRTVALVFALLTLAWGFSRWRRSAQRDAQRMFEQLDLIRGELLLLSDRMEHLESAAPKVIERPVPQETRAPAPSNSPAPRGYEVAARLARGGATCEELISSCGLSRHEAQLLLRLHNAESTRSKASDKPSVSDERRARLSVVG